MFYIKDIDVKYKELSNRLNSSFVTFLACDIKDAEHDLLGNINVNPTFQIFGKKNLRYQFFGTDFTNEIETKVKYLRSQLFSPPSDYIFQDSL